MPSLVRPLIVSCIGLCSFFACGDSNPTTSPKNHPAPPALPQPTSTSQTANRTPEPIQNALSADCKDFGQTPSTPPELIVHGGGGTDVSEAQGDVPWRSLAQAKLPFVFIKATEGTTLIDPKFEQNWRMAKMCGIPRGAYHVIHPFEPTAEQAKFYLAQLQGDYGELPPVLDIELPTGEPFPPPESYVDSVTTWLDMVQQASGHKGMLYFEHWYYQDILGASPKLHPYRIWAAQYNDHMPEGFVKWPWSFWQHDKPVSWAERMWDQDRFNGTQKQLTDAIAKGWN